MKQPAVYLMASQRNGTLYVGATSDLIKRIWQHRTHAVEGFTQKYSINLLVWFEQHKTMESAIAREKAVKKWNRAWKLNLSKKTNPVWMDFWPVITGEQADFRTPTRSAVSPDFQLAPPSRIPGHFDIPRHSRAGGNPEYTVASGGIKALDSRLSGNDDNAGGHA
ncbi:MAG: GIY-YIG nuclease family protein [Rugosibacter sp.]